ncbi:MAG: MaoC/PaaZ C-terminal domain-containing protein [Promethearchaeota archaeon]
MKEKEILYFEDVSEGMEIPSVKRGPIDRRQLIDYASASGDYNKIHYDEAFAKKAGLKGCIAHGMLTMSLVGTFITNWAIGGSLKYFKVKFVGMTNENDIITVKGSVVNKFKKENENLIEINVSSETHDGIKTIVGSAIISLPSKND